MPGAEPAAPRCVVDLDLRALDAERIGGLERPRELALRRATERAAVDRRDRVDLLVGRALVDVEEVAPRRARLVVVVARRHDDSEVLQVDIAGTPLEDPPAESTETLAIRR